MLRVRHPGSESLAAADQIRVDEGRFCAAKIGKSSASA
jgi:hypothetical protein